MEIMNTKKYPSYKNKDLTWKEIWTPEYGMN